MLLFLSLIQFFGLKLTCAIIFQTDKAGCATQTVNLEVFHLNGIMNYVSFALNAELEEDGTGSLAVYTGPLTVH